MKLRTEDQLGYFSTQMLGQIALPAVTVEAQRVVMQGRRRGMSSRLLEEESLWVCPGCRWADGHAEGCPHDDSEAVGYVAHVDRASGKVQVVAGPGEEIPGEPLTAALYRAAATTGEHRFTIDELKTWGSLEEMNAALNGETE